MVHLGQLLLPCQLQLVIKVDLEYKQQESVVSGFQGPSSPPVSPTGTVSRAALGFDYDGSSWTAGASALISGANGGAAGIQTVAIYLAGENPALISSSSITTSQTYDGTSYTTNASVIRSQSNCNLVLLHQEQLRLELQL